VIEWRQHRSEEFLNNWKIREDYEGDSRRLERIKKGDHEYCRFISAEDFEKFMPLIHHKEWSKKDLDLILKLELDIIRCLWIKQRYPAWHSMEFDYIAEEIARHWSTVTFLDEIKSGKRPLENMIVVFPS